MSLDVNNLLAQADAILQELLQNAQQEGALAKAEKAYKAEDEAEEKKDENASAYESQSPELKSPSPSPSPAPAMAEEDEVKEEAPEEEELDLPAMVKELDDETLRQLFDHIKAELMARSAPEMPAEEPREEEKKDQLEELKMSEKLQAEIKEKDQQIADLHKTVGSLLEIVEMIANKPVQRAITDVSFVERGKQLKKSEPQDLRKSVYEIMGDREKMAQLSPKELDDLLGFYSGAPYKNLETSVRAIIEKVGSK